MRVQQGEDLQPCGVVFSVVQYSDLDAVEVIGVIEYADGETPLRIVHAVVDSRDYSPRALQRVDSVLVTDSARARQWLLLKPLAARACS